MAQNVDLLQGSQPLRGVVLCCTSVPQDARTHLADMATQMGAVHKLDLTSDVTHLIVGSITTPKYQYVARERPDIKVLLPAWLEETRNCWMEGADVDIAALEQKYRCPPFFGLHICLTGFEDIEQRNYISSTAIEQGAKYHGDLTKTVTHLIAAAPQGQKYTHGRRWNITVVSLKWFEDSLLRGMALDESYYDPTAPLEEQGKGAFNRQRASLGKHGRSEDAQNGSNPDFSRKRLRRTASTRLESQSQDMWQDISAEPLKHSDYDTDSWNNDGHRSSTKTLPELPPPRSESTVPGVVSVQPPPTDAGADALFSGYHILIHRFDRSKAAKLGTVLHENGAIIVDTAAQLENASEQPFFKARCLLVPHATSQLDIEVSDVPVGTIVATEWWLERCIHYKRLLNPTEDALSRPIQRSELSGFYNLRISTTGFAGVDVRQIAETVKLVGATYQEQLLPNSNVMVSGSSTVRSEKAFYACKHRIPIVSADWLWESLNNKQAMPYHRFQISVPESNVNELNESSGTGTSAPTRVRQQSGGNGNQRDSRKTESLRLSNSRKGQRTPALALHAPKVRTSATTPPKRLFMYEDDDSDAAQPLAMLDVTHSGSQPLRELSPNRSQGTRTDVVEEEVSKAKNQPVKMSAQPISPSKASSAPVVPLRDADSHTMNEPLPANRSHNELTADLAGLLNRSGASRASSGTPVEIPPRRKNRPLGRASSGTSARSLSANATRETSAPPSKSLNTSSDGLPPPSTQLGYETPEAQAHRLQMSKKMGTKLHDEADVRGVPNLGVVKDTSLMADAGVGNRVKGRARAK